MSEGWRKKKNEGIVARHEGYSADAERLLRDALAEARPFAGQDPDVGSLMNYLADFYLEQGKLDKSLDLARECVALDRHLLDPNSILLANDLLFLARVLSRLGEHDEALKAAKEGAAICEESFGETHGEARKARALLTEMEQRVLQK